jgi:hypothetical protein
MVAESAPILTVARTDLIPSAKGMSSRSVMGDFSRVWLVVRRISVPATEKMIVVGASITARAVAMNVTPTIRVSPLWVARRIACHPSSVARSG